MAFEHPDYPDIDAHRVAQVQAIEQYEREVLAKLQEELGGTATSPRPEETRSETTPEPTKEPQEQKPPEPCKPRSLNLPIGVDTKRWAAGASCREVKDPLIFFSDHPNDIKNAKSVCGGCPVQVECLEHALKNHEYGIWGGTTERERQKIKRSKLKF